MIEAFDRWVHENVMNPAFELVQKWFHWNRFQLIAVGMIATNTIEILVGLAFIILPLEVLESFKVVVVIGGAGLVLAGLMGILLGIQMLPDLKECSDMHENNKRVRATPRMIERRIVIGEHRGVTTSFMALFIIADIFCVSMPGGYLSVSVYLTIIACCEAIESHLWGSNDVDPRDRDSVFEPDVARSSDSA